MKKNIIPVANVTAKLGRKGFYDKGDMLLVGITESGLGTWLVRVYDQ